jgi:bla regulator protein BlaR1
MSANLAHSLLIATMASSLAVLSVGLLRKPMRYAIGARAAYWQWLLVPASVFAVSLPSPVHRAVMLTASLPARVSTAFSIAMQSFSATGPASPYILAALSVWLLGAFVMLVSLVRRHQAFVHSLGYLTSDAQGIFRSTSIAAPLLVGAWRPHIVVPTDFEARYSADERILALAHERAHLVRGDIAINIVAAGWLCLAWFNPLMYWAAGRLRFDQELACDETVLSTSKISRGRYAKALLKTQLANESAWRVPGGCHWHSIHPLQERIAMLKHPSPGLARRLTGIAASVALTIAGSYAVWAAQPELSTGLSGRVIAVNMKWWVNGADVLPGGSSAAQDIRVVSGKEFVRRVSFEAGQSFEARCFASLSNKDKPSPIWQMAKSSGTPIEGLILLECTLSNDDKIFSTPAVLVGDGKLAAIDVANPEGTVHYKIEFNASTHSARTAAVL